MSKIHIAVIAIFLGVVISLLILVTRSNTLTTLLQQDTNSSHSPSTQPHSVNKQASFAIFTNGTFRIFTATMYHNLSPNVYIQADNPNIVNVKKTGTTWNDFFSTLPITLTPKCLTTGTGQTFCTGESGTLKFYINGEQNKDALDQEIQEGDKLLVTFGNEPDSIIQSQMKEIP